MEITLYLTQLNTAGNRLWMTAWMTNWIPEAAPTLWKACRVSNSRQQEYARNESIKVIESLWLSQLISSQFGTRGGIKATKKRKNYMSRTNISVNLCKLRSSMRLFIKDMIWSITLPIWWARTPKTSGNTKRQSSMKTQNSQNHQVWLRIWVNCTWHIRTASIT